VKTYKSQENQTDDVGDYLNQQQQSDREKLLSTGGAMNRMKRYRSQRADLGKIRPKSVLQGTPSDQMNNLLQL
jgi:hypothetical protein